MKLSEYMEQNRLDDADMALLVGGDCSRHTVKKWRNGSRVPRSQTLLRIREVTQGQVTADDFLPERAAA